MANPNSQSQYATIEQFLALSLTAASFSKFAIDGYAAITANLQAASSKADLFLSGQLVLPLQSWDMNLTKAVCDIAAKELFAQYGYNPGANGDVNFQRRYIEAMDWLKAVSKKELRLDSNPNYVDSSSGQPAAGRMAVSNLPVGFGFPNLNGNNGGWGC